MSKKRTFDSLLIAVGITSGLIGDYSATTTEMSKIIPATYAFVVWLPIYASGFYFAWWITRPSTPDLGAGTRWLAASFFLSGLWVRVQSSNALEIIVIALTLVAVLVQGHLLSKVHLDNRREALAFQIPSGMLAGWLTLASAVAISDALGISYKSSSTVAIYVAFTVGFAASAATWILPTRIYRLTLVWGLVGVVVEQHSQATQVAVVAVVGIVLAVLMLVRMSVKTRTA